MKKKNNKVSLLKISLLKLPLLKVCIIISLFIFVFPSKVGYADEVENSLNTLVETMQEYVDKTDNGIDVNSLLNDMMTDKGIDYTNLIQKLLNGIYAQIRIGLKESLIAFFVILVMAVVLNLELDKNSDVIEITKLILFIVLSTIFLKTYMQVIIDFKEVVKTVSTTMQVGGVFILTTLACLGKLSTISVIQTGILAMSNIICVLAEFIVIPFFSISIAMNIISQITGNIRLDSMSSTFRKSALYIYTTVIGIYMLILSLQTTITKSFDGIVYKTTQNVIGDFVPVVGKFLADSLDTVCTTTAMIGKSGGVISIISIILICIKPLFKIITLIIVYNLLICISEPINTDKSVIKYIKGYVGVYKDMLGILLGIMVLFIISTGILMGVVNGS